jgi:hypothetical protein
MIIDNYLPHCSDNTIAAIIEDNCGKLWIIRDAAAKKLDWDRF